MAKDKATTCERELSVGVSHIKDAFTNLLD